MRSHPTSISITSTPGTTLAIDTATWLPVDHTDAPHIRDAVCRSRDGQFVADRTSDHEVHIRDMSQPGTFTVPITSTINHPTPGWPCIRSLDVTSPVTDAVFLHDPLALVTAHVDHVIRTWQLDDGTSTPSLTCIAAGPFALSADPPSRTWCHISVARDAIHFVRGAESHPYASLTTAGRAAAVSLLCKDVVVYATNDGVVHVSHRDGYRFQVPLPFLSALHTMPNALTGCMLSSTSSFIGGSVTLSGAVFAGVRAGWGPGGRGKHCPNRRGRGVLRCAVI